jgi:Lipid A core - O-antigen ligase and related enzymes
MSLILIAGFPSIGTMYLQSEGNCWTGLTVHKNILGQWASIGVIIFFWQFWNSQGIFKKLICSFLTTVSFVLLIGSKSQTAVSLTFLGLLLMLCLFVYKKNGKASLLFMIFAFLAILSGALLFNQFFMKFSFIDSIFRAIGKDSSFTGRTDIWGLALHTASYRMLLGYGYATFWMTSAADKIRQICGWDFFSAHNGFLDIYLHLGLLGLGLSLLYIFSALKGIKSIYQRDFKIGILWVVFICVTLLSNFFESNFGIMAHEFWFLSVMVCFRMPEQLVA